MGNIDRDNASWVKSLREASSCGARCGAEIDDHARLDNQRIYPQEQTVASCCVYEIGAVEAVGRTLETAANVFAVEHRRNVSTLS